MRINLLLIEVFSSRGGQEIYLYNIIKTIDKSKFNVFVACPHDNVFNDILSKIPNINIFQINLTSKNNIFVYYKLFRFIVINKIHIVHTNGGRSGLIGRASSILTRSRNVHTPHLLILDYSRIYGRLKSQLYKIVDRFLNRFTHRIIAVCNDNIDGIAKYDKASIKKVVRIYNGIDERKFIPQVKDGNLLDKYSLRGDYVILGFVGRLVEQKGVAYLLQACSTIKDNKWRLVIVGDGPLMNELKSYACKLGIRDKVIFVGESESINNYLNIFDIFVLPSIYEAFPLSIIESLATKTPVIAPNINGIPEIINVKNGKLFELQNVEDLASKIILLMNNQNLRKTLGDNGRMEFLKNFTLSGMIDLTTSLYINLIREN